MTKTECLPCRSTSVKDNPRMVGIRTDCRLDCKTCGFNPEVSKLRREQGALEVVNIDGKPLKRLTFLKGLSV